MQVFLSFTFGEQDQDLVDALDMLVGSHDIAPTTGERLGGEALTEEVRTKIAACDGLIALMTRREQIGSLGEGRWRSHPWVRDELNHARSLNKRTIALFEDGVEVDGAHTERERIVLDRANPLPAYLALSQTLRMWKRDAGMPRIAQLLPADLGQRFRHDKNLTCRYRFVKRGMRSDWLEGEPVPSPGGTLLYIEGVRDEDAFIEVEVRSHDQIEFFSLATPQYIAVELQAREASP